MKKLYSTLALLFALLLFSSNNAHADLLSDESVKNINEAWNDLGDGARNVKNSVKETTKDGVDKLGNAFDTIKQDVTSVFNNDDDDNDDNDDRDDDNDDNDRDDDDDNDDDNDDRDDNDDDDDDRA